MKKMFRTEAVLTATSGIMLEDTMEGCIEVMGHVISQPHLTDAQLPAAFDIVRPAIEAQHPWVTAVEFTGGEENRDKIERKVMLLKRRFGDELPIESLADLAETGFNRLGGGFGL